MAKTRLILLALTILVVGLAAYFVTLYAKGYRFNFETLKFHPKGILVVKTEPTGAQIYINEELKGASDSNFSLSPGVYDVNIKKEGYLTWYKRLTIEKETVTETNVSLFKATPALSPITFSGCFQPVASKDFSRIAFAVLPSQNKDKAGLWVMENGNLPLGFTREPKRITDGDLTNASWQFSPDGREILLESQNGVYLLDTANFTPQNQRVNIASKKESTLLSWKKERQLKLEAQTRNLPLPLQEILKRKTSNVSFSFDENKILYTASASAELAANLIHPIPGASTQREVRNIIIDHTYVYDIKEDRNFLVDDGNNHQRSVFWLTNSRNLVIAEEGKISIMDYDGTNQQIVFTGSYLAPHAYPYINTSKLLILTSFGADSSPNLYSLSIK